MPPGLLAGQGGFYRNGERFQGFKVVKVSGCALEAWQNTMGDHGDCRKVDGGCKLILLTCERE